MWDRLLFSDWSRRSDRVCTQYGVLFLWVLFRSFGRVVIVDRCLKKAMKKSAKKAKKSGGKKKGRSMKKKK